MLKLLIGSRAAVADAMDMSGANAIAYAPAANCEDEAKPIKDPNIGAFIARATIGA